MLESWCKFMSYGLGLLVMIQVGWYHALQRTDPCLQYRSLLIKALFHRLLYSWVGVGASGLGIWELKSRV